MLYYWFIAILPPILYFGLPALLSSTANKKPVRRWSLVIASILFGISWFLPSPLIDGIDTSFTTHLVGGGLFSGFIWMYVVSHLKANPRGLKELSWLVGIVSSLGAANELLELYLVESLGYTINIRDASWDLVANSLGAIIFYVGIILLDELLSRSKKPGILWR